jgi:hypothetical protein
MGSNHLPIMTQQASRGYAFQGKYPKVKEVDRPARYLYVIEHGKTQDHGLKAVWQPCCGKKPKYWLFKHNAKNINSFFRTWA